MAQPPALTSQWIAETQSINTAMYDLYLRCKKLLQKTAANGFYGEVEPANSAVPMADAQAAFLVANDFVQFIENGLVGKADRATTIWKVNRGASV